MIHSNRPAVLFHLPAISLFVLTTLLMTGQLALGAPGPGGPPPGIAKSLQLSVLSSAPDQVTGGDVRIAIDSPPGLRRHIELLLNGDPVDLDQLASGPQRLEGVMPRRGTERAGAQAPALR